MAEESAQRETWLVAAWPGMGNVGVGAAAYLVGKLGANMIHELTSQDLFDLDHIDVKHGMATPGRLPRSMFFLWHNPVGERDLLIFIGEAQPSARGLAFCHRLLEYALQRRITRVFTFAAMATQLHPSDAPRVFGVATSRDLIDQLRPHEVNILQEGQISGLNGVLLAAAIERGLPGLCLLGELPFFAAGVPNPKASQAVLEVFSNLAEIDIDFAELREQAEAVEQGLLELLEKMKQAASEQQDSDEEGFSVPEFARGQDPGDDEPQQRNEQPALDAAQRQKIESMFATAARDRSKAFALKQELDRLGVFKQFEDRFLDLFKAAQ
jgi:proteasome assembly chaperone (PAC2) family protein